MSIVCVAILLSGEVAVLIGGEHGHGVGFMNPETAARQMSPKFMKQLDS